ncbi:hypothetical protein ACTOS9_21765 (plasmid) [Bacillus subtilis]|uniref:Uncharacterized protein n=1 Tax=Bacillus subtilis TaxID=1423 RepID=A0A8I1WH06_BACIU|nr:hypothetical protein [Bacillus subtilis]MBO3796474.1 hypothetical protein [Bacillus subtilis]MCM3191311.1 hypothetical protein [Bacillus subtilis]WEY82932.1 hypothetical protein P5633_00280 [Bacillus subtilis]WGD64165.1 hypothetical protein P5648_22405 [Bacillus subtilis]WGD72644.1 hypothetical protein P5645_21910 [Bacillus subtilis]
MLAKRIFQPEIKKEQVTPTKESLLNKIKLTHYNTISEMIKHENYNEEPVRKMLSELEKEGEIVVLDDKAIRVKPIFPIAIALLLFFSITILPNL